MGRQNHVGNLEICIRDSYRGIGLGKYLTKKIIGLAKKNLRPKFIRLSGVFSTNKLALALYKKLGFKKVARIPKQINYKGKLLDEIIMMK
jgi:ribosomal protein S18 acetylase RimI-like enzyme